jgi:hypothetical protein
VAQHGGLGEQVGAEEGDVAEVWVGQSGDRVHRLLGALLQQQRRGNVGHAHHTVPGLCERT